MYYLWYFINMNAQGVLQQPAVLVPRRVVPMVFTRDFESMLLNTPLNHESLSADIEEAARIGMSTLNELFDVFELAHGKQIKQLVDRTIPLLKSPDTYFTHWQLSIAEDLLDEVDLVLLTHGEEIQSFGLTPLDQSRILVMFAVTGCIITQYNYTNTL